MPRYQTTPRSMAGGNELVCGTPVVDVTTRETRCILHVSYRSLFPQYNETDQEVPDERFSVDCQQAVRL